jgi:hypothetical protein
MTNHKPAYDYLSDGSKNTSSTTKTSLKGINILRRIFLDYSIIITGGW